MKYWGSPHCLRHNFLPSYGGAKYHTRSTVYPDINPLRTKHILLGISFHRLLLAGTPTTAEKMAKQEKTGRTFWDFTAENPLPSIMAFIILIVAIVWALQKVNRVKVPGLELEIQKDTAYIKEPMPVPSPTESTKPIKSIRSPQKISPKIVDKDTSTREAIRKYENSGPGTQVNIEEMKAPLFISTPEKPYRNLTPELERDLISEIEGLIKKNNLPDKCCLKVTYQSDDREAQNFAETIKAFLKRKSYTLVGEGVFYNHYPPYYGLKVYFSYGSIYVQVHSYD